MSSEELDRLMYYWRRVIATATESWARGFALNIQRQARRSSWRPTPKQAALMRQMVAELLKEADGETVLIERE